MVIKWLFSNQRICSCGYFCFVWLDSSELVNANNRWQDKKETDEIFVGFCLLFKLKQQKVVIMLDKNMNTHHSEEKKTKTQY